MKTRNMHTAFHRATNNIIQGLACETRVLGGDDVLDSTNRKQVSRTFESITNKAHQLFRVVSRNKVHVEKENTEHDICKVASDKVKARLLKETLRSQGIITNTAIQQYLIQNEVRNCILEQNSDIYENINFSSGTMLGNHESNVSITKEKHGYQWKISVATPSRYVNIRIIRKEEFE